MILLIQHWAQLIENIVMAWRMIMIGTLTNKLPLGWYRIKRNDFIDHKVNPRNDVNKKDPEKRIYWRWEINA